MNNNYTAYLLCNPHLAVRVYKSEAAGKVTLYVYIMHMI